MAKRSKWNFFYETIGAVDASKWVEKEGEDK
jgi:hypothetical protein